MGTLTTNDDTRDTTDLSALVVIFLEEHGRSHYSTLRPRLLAFCLRELIHPEVIVQLVLSQVVRIPERQRDKLVNDWPLRHIYRACALFWN
jgi:hypothetical protein